MYIYTGGEPLVRKKDLIRLCEAHSDCIFLCFTNATLIDEAFADELLRVKNFIPAISLDGSEAATDGRRGSGVYRQVMQALELLRRKKLVYGISACYTSANFDSITSEEFFDGLIELGYYFIWYFHYDGQPFNDNMLRPCPMLENPEKLREMVARTGTRSTDPESPESADHLCAKCDPYARRWAPEAEALWAESQAQKRAGAKEQEEASRPQRLAVPASRSYSIPAFSQSSGEPNLE